MKFKIGDLVTWVNPLYNSTYKVSSIENNRVYLRYSLTDTFAGYVDDLEKLRKLTKLELALK